MSKRGKKYTAVLAKVDRNKKYNLDEAFAALKETKITKYDETVNVSVRLGVDPKKSDQMVRGAITLPHGVGKNVKVLVIAKGDKETEAREAGADFVGSEDMIEKIQKGWLDFDKMIATPDVMGLVGRLGKILGPRGLMPNPKVGTVSFDVAKMVKEIKAGRVEFKVEKAGIVQAPIGKISFEPAKLKENFLAIMEAIQKAKPASSKGTYMKSVTVSSCAGPGIKINQLDIETALR